MLAITGKLSWPSNLLLLAGVSRSRALRQPVSRKSRESFVLSGWDSMCQPYIESATALSDSDFQFEPIMYFEDILAASTLSLLLIACIKFSDFEHVEFNVY